MLAGLVVDGVMDVIRLLVIACNFFVLGLMLSIHLRHRLVLRWPLRLLGVSYALWTAACMVELYTRFGQPFAWRTPLEGAAAVIGLAGLLWLDHYDHHEPLHRGRR